MEARGSKARLAHLLATDIRPWLGLASVLSLLCLLVAPFPLGFDPNAWVTWATAIGHGNSIKFLIEPNWKPLPVLLMAPFAAVSVNLAAAVWMFVVRFCAFLIPGLIFRLVRPTFGTKAAVLSAISPIAISTLWVVSADGHSESLVAACALSAAVLVSAGRQTAAIALATALCLMRPEAVLILAALGVWSLFKRDWNRVALLLVAASVFAVSWFGIPWIVSGDALNGLAAARNVIPFRPQLTALQNIKMPSVKGLWPPRLLVAPLVLAGLVAVRRKRDTPIELLLLAAATFTVVAVATLLSGAPGDPRYFLIVSISACCLIGPGAMLLIEMIPSARAAAAAYAALALVLVAAVPLPGFPLDHGRAGVPGSETAKGLDAGAKALRIAIRRRGALNCPGVTISPDYVTWPHLAARTGHPMSDFNYIATAPVISVEQSITRSSSEKQSPYVLIHGSTATPKALGRVSGGGRTWTVKYYPGQHNCS